MSRFTGVVQGRLRPWYRGSEAPFLLGWSLWLGALTVVLALGLGSRRSPAEAAFDRWAGEQQRPASWRKCHDQQPLPDGMVRCEAGFGAMGRALVYCPGERSTEQTCRWL